MLYQNSVGSRGQSLANLSPYLYTYKEPPRSIPLAYVVSLVCSLRAGTSNRVVVPARQAGNRFLGSLGLQIRALEKLLWEHMPRKIELAAAWAEMRLQLTRKLQWIDRNI